MEGDALRGGDSEISAVFPALTRAKQRFSERKASAAGAAAVVAPATPSASHKEPSQATGGDQAAVRRTHGVDLRFATRRKPGSNAVVASRSASPTETKPPYLKLLLDLCADLDDDLHVLTHEVRVIDSSVRQEHQRICSDLDALTTRFINSGPAEPLQVWLASETAPRRAQVASEDSETVGGLSQSLEKQKKHARPSKSAVIAQQAHPHQQTHQRSAHKQSRVALLAREAVHAHVIQHHIRRLLYFLLYPGGKPQFTAAQQLRRRASLARVWRRWRTNFLTQRRRIMARFVRIERLLSTRANEICARQAAQVRERDGKYAMAKRFFEMKALCSAFRRWLCL